MRQREALNAAGVCDQSDRFNCKYCRRAGRDCEGYALSEGVPPQAAGGPGNKGAIDELQDVYKKGAAEMEAALKSAIVRGRAKRRRLVREEYLEYDEPPHYMDNGVMVVLPGPWRRLKCWNFHYSDGDFEQVIRRGPEV